MRVALVVAPYDTARFRSGPALGPQYLASTLSVQGHEVAVYDLTMQSIPVDEYLKHLQNGNYSIVGFSCLFTANLQKTIELARRTRELCRTTYICIGGQATSFLWKDILETCPELDSAVCFEGEDTICDLADAVQGRRTLTDIRGLYARVGPNIVFTGYRSPRENLDSIPFPRRDASSAVLKQPHFVMLTSRGCSAHCTFCCSGNFGNAYHSAPPWRPRSTENMLRELDQLVADYGAQAVSFVDDDFLGACSSGPPRAGDFSNSLLKRGYGLKWSIECRVNEVESELFRRMKAAGLRHVFIGLESGNAGDLKLFGKGASLEHARQAVNILRGLELSFRIGFIMFHPLTTLKLVAENLDFLSSIGVAGTQVLTNRVELYAGSPLLQFFSRKCEIKRRDFLYSYDIINVTVRVYRQLLKAALRPYKPIEAELDRLFFTLQTGIELHQQHFDEQRAEALLRKLQSELWSAELMTAGDLLTRIKRWKVEGGAAQATEEARVQELSSHYAMFVPKIQKELETIRSSISRGD